MEAPTSRADETVYHSSLLETVYRKVNGKEWRDFAGRLWPKISRRDLALVQALREELAEEGSHLRMLDEDEAIVVVENGAKLKILLDEGEKAKRIFFRADPDQLLSPFGRLTHYDILVEAPHRSRFYQRCCLTGVRNDNGVLVCSALPYARVEIGQITHPDPRYLPADSPLPIMASASPSGRSTVFRRSPSSSPNYPFTVGFADEIELPLANGNTRLVIPLVEAE